MTTGRDKLARLGIELPMLPITAVGSYGKPQELTKLRAKFTKGDITAAELHAKQEEATAMWMGFQNEIGVDVPVDGEMYRTDMVEYFAEEMDGFEASGWVRAYGNRYYRKPVVTGPVRWTRPVTVDWFRYACAQTARPVKAILTGPYTLMDWAFDEHYGSRESLVLALADVVRQECEALVESGAIYLQIDEPAISVRPDEIDLAIRAMHRVTDGLRARTITHICYGDFAAIYPRLLDLPVEQFTLELSNSALGLLDLFRSSPFTKELGAGVVDVHHHTVEPVEVVRGRIEAALGVVPASRLWINPDCGLKTREPAEAEEKVGNMVAATREVRASL